MSKYLFAAVAAAAVASPVVARDGPYVGVEGGALLVQKTTADYQGITGLTDGTIGIKHKTGIDLDAIAGYDFGMFRVEGELGYKKAGIKSTNPNIPFFTFFEDGGRGRTVSAMVNALVDFGPDDGLNGYVGGGVGAARTSYKVNIISFGGTDSNFAWQLIAGIRYPVSPHFDVGLKYRYFSTKYNLNEGPTEELLGKWRSHSLLASLIYNF